MALLRILTLAAAALPLALARTDLGGCTYTDLVVQATRQQDAYASRLYYVPDTGEVCDLLDCGGGRAPPKTTVPGCPDYAGTETYQPSYINPQTLGGVVPAGSSVVMATTPVTPTPTTTTAASSSSVVSTTADATEGSVTILTGTNTPSSSPSSASGGASTSKTAAASGGSSSSAARTTIPSSAAGAMQTVGAVLGPCVVAAIAAGLA